MKGFTPVQKKIAELIEHWAQFYVHSGRDPLWSRFGSPDLDEADRRIGHHCEYLNAVWRPKESRAEILRGNGSLFLKEEEQALFDELEKFLNERLRVVTVLFGLPLDQSYHIDEDQLDMKNLKSISDYCRGQSHLKHLCPLRDEVVIDVSKR